MRSDSRTNAPAPNRSVVPKDLFRVLTPVDALARLSAHLPSEPRRERVPTVEALGRTLAEELQSHEDLPAFPRSTMDGFAVRAADTFGASDGLPACLTVRGEILMGARPDREVRPGEAL